MKCFTSMFLFVLNVFFNVNMPPHLVFKKSQDFLSGGGPIDYLVKYYMGLHKVVFGAFFFLKHLHFDLGE